MNEYYIHTAGGFWTDTRVAETPEKALIESYQESKTDVEPLVFLDTPYIVSEITDRLNRHRTVHLVTLRNPGITAEVG